jgi:hypothetical protein
MPPRLCYFPIYLLSFFPPLPILSVNSFHSKFCCVFSLLWPVSFNVVPFGPRKSWCPIYTASLFNQPRRYSTAFPPIGITSASPTANFRSPFPLKSHTTPNFSNIMIKQPSVHLCEAKASINIFQSIPFLVFSPAIFKFRTLAPSADPDSHSTQWVCHGNLMIKFRLCFSLRVALFVLLSSWTANSVAPAGVVILSIHLYAAQWTELTPHFCHPPPCRALTSSASSSWKLDVGYLHKNPTRNIWRTMCTMTRTSGAQIIPQFPLTSASIPPVRHPFLRTALSHLPCALLSQHLLHLVAIGQLVMLSLSKF